MFKLSSIPQLDQWLQDIPENPEGDQAKGWQSAAKRVQDIADSTDDPEVAIDRLHTIIERTPTPKTDRDQGRLSAFQDAMEAIGGAVVGDNPVQVEDAPRVDNDVNQVTRTVPPEMPGDPARGVVGIKEAGLLDDLHDEDDDEVPQQDPMQGWWDKQMQGQERQDLSELYKVIMEAGGIRTRDDLREEYQGIPNTYKRRDGLSGDEMAEYLSYYHPEFGIEDEDDLVQVLGDVHRYSSLSKDKDSVMRSKTSNRLNEVRDEAMQHEEEIQGEYARQPVEDEIFLVGPDGEFVVSEAMSTHEIMTPFLDQAFAERFDIDDDDPFWDIGGEYERLENEYNQGAIQGFLMRGLVGIYPNYIARGGVPSPSEMTSEQIQWAIDYLSRGNDGAYREIEIEFPNYSFNGTRSDAIAWLGGASKQSSLSKEGGPVSFESELSFLVLPSGEVYSDSESSHDSILFNNSLYEKSPVAYMVRGVIHQDEMYLTPYQYWLGEEGLFPLSGEQLKSIEELSQETGAPIVDSEFPNLKVTFKEGKEQPGEEQFRALQEQATPWENPNPEPPKEDLKTQLEQLGVTDQPPGDAANVLVFRNTHYYWPTQNQEILNEVTAAQELAHEDVMDLIYEFYPDAMDTDFQVGYYIKGTHELYDTQGNFLGAKGGDENQSGEQLDPGGAEASPETQDFFSAVMNGEHRPNQPLREEDLSQDPTHQSIYEEMQQHMGNFDEHIETSIPDYRNNSLRKIEALLNMGGGTFLDIAGSTGALGKTLSSLSNGAWQTVNLDPNPQMAQHFESDPVEGASIVPEAFGGSFEMDGVEVPHHDPQNNKYDVVHESMGFQFIGSDRESQVREAKGLLNEGGLFLSEEKFHTENEQEKERIKDEEFKSKYYSNEQLERKNQEVGFQETQASKTSVMTDNLVSDMEYRELLEQYFQFVEVYWEEGNFLGYASSDSQETINQFLGGVGRGSEEIASEDPQTILEYNKGQDLEGLPGEVKVRGIGKLQFHSNREVQETAQRYNEEMGINKEHPTDYVKVQPDIMQAVAEEYERMEHNPQDPEVAEAYGALARETLAQYEYAINQGYTFEFYPEGEDPYPNSPREAILDLHQNKHMYVFPTEVGYGTTEEGDYAKGGGEYDDHPMLQDSGIRWNDKPVTYGDLFRAVHDFFGHAKEGVGFRADGEDNAYRQHAAMFSDTAQKAMVSETRGESAWVNYGPYAATNQTATTADTVFAEPKAGIMPEWTYDPDINKVGGERVSKRADWWNEDTGEDTELHHQLIDKTSLNKFVVDTNGEFYFWPTSESGAPHHDNIVEQFFGNYDNIIELGFYRPVAQGFVETSGMETIPPQYDPSAPYVEIYQGTDFMEAEEIDDLCGAISRLTGVKQIRDVVMDVIFVPVEYGEWTSDGQPRDEDEEVYSKKADFWDETEDIDPYEMEGELEKEFTIDATDLEDSRISSDPVMTKVNKFLYANGQAYYWDAYEDIEHIDVINALGWDIGNPKGIYMGVYALEKDPLATKVEVPEINSFENTIPPWIAEELDRAFDSSTIMLNGTHMNLTQNVMAEVQRYDTGVVADDSLSAEEGVIKEEPTPGGYNKFMVAEWELLFWLVNPQTLQPFHMKMDKRVRSKNPLAQIQMTGFWSDQQDLYQIEGSKGNLIVKMRPGQDVDECVDFLRAKLPMIPRAFFAGLGWYDIGGGGAEVQEDVQNEAQVSDTPVPGGTNSLVANSSEVIYWLDNGTMTHPEGMDLLYGDVNTAAEDPSIVWGSFNNGHMELDGYGDEIPPETMRILMQAPVESINYREEPVEQGDQVGVFGRSNI